MITVFWSGWAIGALVGWGLGVHAARRFPWL